MNPCRIWFEPRTWGGDSYEFGQAVFWFTLDVSGTLGMERTWNRSGADILVYWDRAEVPEDHQDPMLRPDHQLLFLDSAQLYEMNETDRRRYLKMLFRTVRSQ